MGFCLVSEKWRKLKDRPDRKGLLAAVGVSRDHRKQEPIQVKG